MSLSEQALMQRPSYECVSLHPRLRARARLATRIVTLAALTWAGACLDHQALVEPPNISPNADTFAVVSNPVPVMGSSRAGAAPLVDQASEAEVVYVSLPSGTIPTGGLATVRNTRTGATVSAAMEAGGFDPVAIGASVGDALVLDVQLEGGGHQVLRLTVPAARRPIVVRTDPPPKKRDVPLNAVLYAVFSEPIAPSAAAGIRVLQGGAPVSGTTVRSPDGLRVEFRPTQPLAANTDYVLSVPSTVADVSGEPLEQGQDVEFTTGTLVAMASVSTPQAALFYPQAGGNPRAFNVDAIRDSSGRVSGNFTIFYQPDGARLVGRVLCFAIVNNSSVWMAGVVDSSGSGAGAKFGWRAVDRGSPGVDAPDGLSLAYPLAPDGLLSVQNWCATTPVRDAMFGDIALHDLTSGDIVVAGVAPPPPPDSITPPPPPSVSQIAFFSPAKAILVVGADGSDLRSLTNGPNDNNPAWSPDGLKVAFQSDRSQQNDWDIYTINWDSTGLTRLTSGPETDQDPAFSPDGTRIAFLRNGSIHVMKADGDSLTRLSFACCDSHPTWAPDGSRIAFSSSRSGVNGIYIMNADGSGVVPLTMAGNDYSPIWSPDGGKISFARKTQQADEGAYLINADGSGLTQLTLGINGHASWAPDGTRLVYELFGMNIINADGTGLRMMLSGTFNPVWSPVGTVPPAPVPFRSIEKVSGDAQVGTIGDTLAQQLRVRVVHDDGTPQAGVHVWWHAFGSGAGAGVWLGPFPTFTDSLGYSSVWARLGSTPGQVRVRAAVGDGSARRFEVVFTATAVP